MAGTYISLVKNIGLRVRFKNLGRRRVALTFEVEKCTL